MGFVEVPTGVLGVGGLERATWKEPRTVPEVAPPSTPVQQGKPPPTLFRTDVCRGVASTGSYAPPNLWHTDHFPIDISENQLRGHRKRNV